MQTVSKSKFAEMVGRTPAAVSQWIAAGKLHGDALVGEGRHAQINVEVALRQLGMNLDLGQQLAQPRPIVGGSPSDPGGGGKPGNDQQRLLKARADREELALEADRAKALEANGRWMVTARAEDEWSRQLAALVQATETWLVTTAAGECATAAANGAGARDFGKILKEGYRDLRQRLADQAAREARDLPELDDDDLDDPEDEE